MIEQRLEILALGRSPCGRSNKSNAGTQLRQSSKKSAKVVRGADGNETNYFGFRAIENLQRHYAQAIVSNFINANFHF
jgi:hypothetical protein